MSRHHNPKPRCPACDLRKPETEFRVLPSGGRSRVCPPCEAMKTARGLRRIGISTSEPMPSKNICVVCHGMPWRVVGPRCRGCKLLYEAEPVQSVDGFARGPSALARAI